MFKLWFRTLLCFLLVCIGLSWFVYQSLYQLPLSPNQPNWGNSHWIQSSDANTSVSYFRTVIPLETLPDSAFVTIAARQIFRLYLNGTLIGSNSSHFAATGVLNASIYDVLSVLGPGPNILGVQVTNIDQGSPLLRVNFGQMRDSTLFSSGSNFDWLATSRDNLVYTSPSKFVNAWTRKDFLATTWPPAISNQFTDHLPLLTLPPALYEHPSAHWISAGLGHETYLLGSFFLPPSSTGVWLRLAAIGNVHVYLNGSPVLDWQGLPTLSRQRLVSYMSGTPYEPQSRYGIPASISSLTPYLHSGQNTIALHVQSPQNAATFSGLETLNAALSLDLLVLNSHAPDQPLWITPDSHWHSSPLSIPNWQYFDPRTRSWPTPVFIPRPLTARLFYLPSEMTNRSFVPRTPEPSLYVLLPCCFLSLILYLLLAWILKKISFHTYNLSFHSSLYLTFFAVLPSLTCEILLSLLSTEPLFPSFYTHSWGIFLLLFFTLCYVILCYALRCKTHSFSWLAQPAQNIPSCKPSKPFRLARFFLHLGGREKLKPLFDLLFPLLWPYIRRHWPLLPILLLALPLVSYNLSYEPYWQDELSSYYAAQGILTHSLPFFPSGFLYEKAELFSYLLALWQFFFGTSASRLLSVFIYLLSLPLFYALGNYFFERRTALLATSMLAFSPSALLWSRQTRMYELAQVLMFLTLFLLCRALTQPQRARPIYLTTISMIAMYLSHEETFIALPGFLLIICLYSRRLPGHLFPIICYQRHWWCSAFLAVSIISIQLFLTHSTHPPVLGTDSSQRPVLQLSFDNVPYYLHLLFFPFISNKTILPNSALNTLLALSGAFFAFWHTNLRARFCSLFFLSSLACLLLLFTMRAERYLYPLLPTYYLLGASMLVHIFSSFRSDICSLVPASGVGSGDYPPLPSVTFYPIRLLSTLIAALIIASLFLFPTLPISNYNLLVSRVFGLSYHHHYPDYAASGRYIQAHWRSGDILISIAPDFSVFYYTGHVDYFLSIDRALFLLERNGHIVDTSLGALALFQQDDLLAVLSKHNRVWIVSDKGGYQAQAAKRIFFPDDVHLVFEGYGSAVYFRGG